MEPLKIKLRLPSHSETDENATTAIKNDIENKLKLDIKNQVPEQTITLDYHKQSTIARIESIADSCTYLIENVLSKMDQRDRKDDISEKLKTCAQELKTKACNKCNDQNNNNMLPTEANSVRDKALKEFSQDIIRILAQAYPAGNKTDANKIEHYAELLSRAEGFMVLRQPRSQYVTVLPIPAEDGKYRPDEHVVMVETPQDGISSAMAEKYLNFIEHPDPSDSNHPECFNVLKPEERLMLQHELNELEKKAEIDGVDLKPSKEPHLDKKAKDYLINNLVNFSSKLRIIPALPNAYVHQCYLMKKGQEPKLINQEGRSSMISSRDLQKRLKKSVKTGKLTPAEAGKQLLDHAYENFDLQIRQQLKGAVQKAMEDNPELTELELPVLFQTMISPYDFGITKLDVEMYDYKQKAVEKLKDEIRDNGIEVKLEGSDGETKTIKVKPLIFETNHPINYTSRLHGASGKSAESKKDTRELIKYAKNMIEEGNIKGDPLKTEIEDLIQNLEIDLKTSFNITKKANQGLMINTHEQLLVQKLGGVTMGSCVSGKDRKATEIMHTDAAALYNEIKADHKYPGFHKESASKHKHFLNLFSEIFCSRHHQLLSAENSKGSEGIKNVGVYLGKDHGDAINDKMWDLLGTKLTNRLSDIKSKLTDKIQQIMGKKKNNKIFDEFTTNNKVAGRNEYSRLVRGMKLSPSEALKDMMDDIKSLSESEAKVILETMGKDIKEDIELNGKFEFKAGISLSSIKVGETTKRVPASIAKVDGLINQALNTGGDANELLEKAREIINTKMSSDLTKTSPRTIKLYKLLESKSGIKEEAKDTNDNSKENRAPNNESTDSVSKLHAHKDMFQNLKNTDEINKQKESESQKSERHSSTISKK